MLTKLTQSVVQNAKPAEKLYWIRDSLVRGFILSVSYGGKKTYCVDYKNLNGKRATYKIGDATRYTVAEAREEAQTFLAAIERGKDPLKPEKKVSLGEFIQKVYEPWVLENRRAGSSTLYAIKLNFSFLFDTPLDEINITEIEKWRSKRKKDGLKNASINRVTKSLKAAVNWAVKRGIIEVHPLAKLENFSEEDSETKVRFLSEEERARLMAALDAYEEEVRQGHSHYNTWLRTQGIKARPLKEGDFAHHLKPIVLLSLSTGIRRNGVLSLEWRDVDFGNRTVTVRALSSKSGKQYHVPLNDLAFDTLSRWHSQSSNTSPGSLVFPSPPTGKKMTRCCTWGALLKRAKISGFRWHDMRHDFASQLVMGGVDLNTVRELLGHSDLKMTLRYAHLAPEKKLQAVKVLDRIQSSSGVYTGSTQ